MISSVEEKNSMVFRGEFSLQFNHKLIILSLIKMVGTKKIQVNVTIWKNKKKLQHRNSESAPLVKEEDSKYTLLGKLN